MGTGMAKGCKAISLIKGIEFEEKGPVLISNMIKHEMGGMDVSVLMGANVENDVALGAGFCDGLDLGGNTKAAIIRIGLKETAKFAKTFFSGIKDDTFMESCGLADLVTTCFGGRNRKCAEAFARGEGDWDTIEKKLLNGQKLQGTITSKDVATVLRAKGMEKDFPLFTRIYEIAYEGKPASSIIEM